MSINEEQTIMQIIVNGGDARSKALQSIRKARVKHFDEADSLLKEAKQSMGVAHEVQTKLIQAETRGDKAEVSLLMVHAQDHLMNAMTVVDLAVELIEDFKIREEKYHD